MKAKPIAALLVISACSWCVAVRSDDPSTGNEDPPAKEAPVIVPATAKSESPAPDVPMLIPEGQTIPKFGASNDPLEEAPQPTRKANIKAPEIAGYKKWKVVNEKPYFVPMPEFTLCASSSALPPVNNKIQVGPSPNEWRGHHPSTLGKYIRVLVNDKGKTAMFAKNPQFPVGSVVVKEKLPDAKSHTPELLTVMIKREAGFDRAKGDWEYLVADGKGQKAFERGKLQNCQACHLARPNSDYVFRDYMK